MEGAKDQLLRSRRIEDVESCWGEQVGEVASWHCWEGFQRKRRSKLPAQFTSDEGAERDLYACHKREAVLARLLNITSLELYYHVTTHFSYQTFRLSVFVNLEWNLERLTQFLWPSKRPSACSNTCLYASSLVTLRAKLEASAWTCGKSLLHSCQGISRVESRTIGKGTKNLLGLRLYCTQ